MNVLNTNFEHLRIVALQCMSEGPFSVTHKIHSEYCVDKHDYLSGKLYWWKQGAEYVRRDGVPNPDNFGPAFDRARLESFITVVTILVNAYSVFNKNDFGERAAELIRVWFLDVETKMMPRLEYAQVIPGKTSDGLGIIDTYDFIYLVDAIELLIKDGLLGKEDKRQLVAWFSMFVRWVMKSKPGRREQKRQNNHGTSADVQIARFLDFTGKRISARFLVSRMLRSRVAIQINSEGVQPEEMGRTKSLYYHWYNLTKLMHLFLIAKHLRVPTGSVHHKIESALNFLLKFVENESEWFGEQIEPLELVDYLEPMYIGKKYFKNSKCREYLASKTNIMDLTEDYGMFSLPVSAVRRLM